MIAQLAPLLLLVIVLASVGSGYLYLVCSRTNRRNARLHLGQLQEKWDEIPQSGDYDYPEKLKSLVQLNGAYAEAGLFEMGEIVAFKKRQRAAFIRGTIGIFAVTVISAGLTGKGILLGVIFGPALSYLYAERMLRLEQKEFYRKLVFFLPVVMERLVMAVQAGLDIVPAIQTIVSIESPNDASVRSARVDVSHQSLAPYQQDPVSKLLSIVSKLCNAGLPFEQALREITSRVDSTAVKHSFLHLAVAHREGGELVAPLRELSDATQLYYQETVEEEIAVMPVKATMPLVLTFAGLLIIFITSPILQIGKFTKNSSPKPISTSHR